MLTAGRGRRIVGSGGCQSQLRILQQRQIQKLATCLSYAPSTTFQPFVTKQSTIRSFWFFTSTPAVPEEQPISNTPQCETTDEMSWIKTTDEILHQEIGSVTPHQWQKAEESFSYWVGLRTKEGVDEAWKLLDRLVEEERHGATVESGVTTEWLVRILYAWRKTIRTNTDGYSTVMKHKDVLQKIDAYSPILLPDPRVYQMIVTMAVTLDPSGAPDFCQMVLDRMDKESEANPLVRPDDVMHGMLLRTYAWSGRPDAARQAEAELKRRSAIGGELAPTNRDYTITISAWANSGEKDAPQRAEALLREMEESTSPEVYPNTMAFSAVLNAWAKSKEPGAAERAESILNHMETLYKDGNDKVKPNVVSYSTVVNAYALAGRPQEAEEVLQRLENVYESTRDAELCPHVIVLNIMCGAWLKSKDPDAAKRAEIILSRMEALYMDGNKNFRPSRILYSFIMAAYAKAGQAREAEALHQRLKDMYEASGDAALCPNTITYSTLISAWARSKEAGAAERAKGILDQMEMWYMGGNDKVKPNAVTYSTVIYAFAHANRPQEAEKVLRRLQDEYERTGDTELCPGVVPFTTVLTAWAKCNEHGAAERAENVLNTMEALYKGGNDNVKPDSHLYTSVMAAYARSGRKEAPKRIQAILRRMVELSSNGDEARKPTTIHYTKLVSAYARVGNAVAAESILNRMEREASEGNKDVRPNTFTFNNVIASYAKSRDQSSIQKAESIALRMQKMYEAGDTSVEPNTYTFTQVICALSWSRDPSACEKAIRYLDYLKESFAAGHHNCKPNSVVYTAVIHSLESSREPNSVDKACALLREMREQAQKGDHDVKPDARTYLALLKVIASSGLPDKAERTRQVLQEMTNESLEPSIQGYNEIIHWCIFDDGDNERKSNTFRMALETFQTIHCSKHLQPNLNTYVRFLQACVNCVDEDERARAVKECYQRCCENGFGSHAQIKKSMETLHLLPYLEGNVTSLTSC